jgi:hypothetical protein
MMKCSADRHGSELAAPLPTRATQILKFIKPSQTNESRNTSHRHISTWDITKTRQEPQYVIPKTINIFKPAKNHRHNSQCHTPPVRNSKLNPTKHGHNPPSTYSLSSFSPTFKKRKNPNYKQQPSPSLSPTQQTATLNI